MIPTGAGRDHVRESDGYAGDRARLSSRLGDEELDDLGVPPVGVDDGARGPVAGRPPVVAVVGRRSDLEYGGRDRGRRQVGGAGLVVVLPRAGERVAVVAGLGRISSLGRTVGDVDGVAGGVVVGPGGIGCGEVVVWVDSAAHTPMAGRSAGPDCRAEQANGSHDDRRQGGECPAAAPTGFLIPVLAAGACWRAYSMFSAPTPKWSPASMSAARAACAAEPSTCLTWLARASGWRDAAAPTWLAACAASTAAGVLASSAAR